MKNLIGNALIVLILLMSCFFFAAALMVGAAQRNWKAEVVAWQSRAEVAERQVNDAKSQTKEQVMTIEREKVSRAQQLATLFSQTRQLNEQLEAQNKVLKAEIESNQAHLARLREAEARVAQQDTELQTTKALNTEYKNNIAEQFQKVTNLTQETFEQQTKIDTLEQMVADLSADVSIRSKIMETLGVDKQYLFKDVVPKLTATIFEIGQTRKTFAIKLGSDDGIRIGHQFDIYRSNRFIGRAQVTLVRQDVSVLKLLDGLSNSPIQEGDYVTSQLN